MDKSMKEYKDQIKDMYSRGFKDHFYVGRLGNGVSGKGDWFKPREATILETYSFPDPEAPMEKIFLYGIRTKLGIKGLLERKTASEDSERIGRFIKKTIEE